MKRQKGFYIKSVLRQDDGSAYLVTTENEEEFLFEERVIQDALAGVKQEILRRIRVIRSAQSKLTFR